MTRRLIPVSIALALSGLACDSAPPSGPIAVHPVTGQVMFKGKPVPDAIVVLHPESPATSLSKPGDDAPPRAAIPTGKTDSEGRFQMHTYVWTDGAPTGIYRVTVVLAGASENRNFMAKNSVAVSSVTLPAKYASPAQSGLTATVEAGDNVIPPYQL